MKSIEHNKIDISEFNTLKQSNSLVKDSVYYVKDGQECYSYVTDSSGNPFKVSGEDLYSAISQWDNDAGLEYPSVRSYKGGIWRVKDGKTTTSSDFPVSGSSVWEKITDSFNLFRSSNYFSQGTILNNTCVVQVNSVPQITSKTGWQSVLLD